MGQADIALNVILAGIVLLSDDIPTELLRNFEVLTKPPIKRKKWYNREKMGEREC